MELKIIFLLYSFLSLVLPGIQGYLLIRYFTPAGTSVPLEVIVAVHSFMVYPTLFIFKVRIFFNPEYNYYKKQLPVSCPAGPQNN